jgi:hypothetical protein
MGYVVGFIVCYVGGAFAVGFSIDKIAAWFDRLGRKITH